MIHTTRGWSEVRKWGLRAAVAVLVLGWVGAAAGGLWLYLRCQDHGGCGIISQEFMDGAQQSAAQTGFRFGFLHGQASVTCKGEKT